MSLWTFLFGANDSSSTDFSNTTNTPTINPANGLPMINGIGSVDIAGNVFGTDANNNSSHSDLTSSISNDSIFDSSSTWDSNSSIDTSSSFDSGSSFDSSSSWD